MSEHGLTIRAEAESDIDSAFDWYESQRLGLGDEFLVSLHDAIDRIRQRPEAHPRFNERFQCSLLNRFPYGVFFTVEAGHIIVFGVLHGRRDRSILDDRSS